jgi:PilZ domain-containing protein
MEDKDTRRSDRISLELALEVSGSDATGREFFEAGRTTVVSRHGAKIVVARKLVPQQEITVRCLETGQEAVGRVVGQIEAGPENYTYGILLVDPEANPWGIEFTAAARSSGVVGRVVLECFACHTREVAYLDEFELEVLEANQSLTRYCKRCTDTSLWKKSFGQPTPEPEVPRPRVPEEPRKTRRSPRREMKVVACVRSHEFGEDLVTTRNVSRGGICFESSKRYGEGWKVEVAVPYSKGGGNIFVPGRIAYARESPATDVVVYGVAYTEQKGQAEPASGAPAWEDPDPRS